MFRTMAVSVISDARWLPTVVLTIGPAVMSLEPVCLFTILLNELKIYLYCFSLTLISDVTEITLTLNPLQQLVIQMRIF